MDANISFSGFVNLILYIQPSKVFAAILSNLHLLKKKKKKAGNLVSRAVEMQRGIGGTALLQDHSEYVNSSAFLELSQLENPAC